MAADTPIDSRCEAALHALYTETFHRGADQHMHAIDGTTRISRQQGYQLAETIKKHGCKKTLEIGFAYGFSTLYILGALPGAGASHTAIDPNETSIWNGIGLEKIKDSKMTDRFTWIGEESLLALAKLGAQGDRFDFIYIDGDHKFDAIMVDLYGSDRLLDINGILALDDLWMPSTRAATAFMESNLAHYRRLPSAAHNLALYEKIGADVREWWHYTPFTAPQDAGRWTLSKEAT